MLAEVLSRSCDGADRREAVVVLQRYLASEYAARSPTAVCGPCPTSVISGCVKSSHMRCEVLCLALARPPSPPAGREISMSDKSNKRGASVLFELALTFSAGAFVFFTFSGLLHAYAP